MGVLLPKKTGYFGKLLKLFSNLSQLRQNKLITVGWLLLSYNKYMLFTREDALRWNEHFSGGGEGWLAKQQNSKSEKVLATKSNEYSTL